MTDSAYYNLMSEKLKGIQIENCTKYFNKNDSTNNFGFTAGIKDERDNYRSPLLLIWRIPSLP
jgi:hypothetical protein